MKNYWEIIDKNSYWIFYSLLTLKTLENMGLYLKFPSFVLIVFYVLVLGSKITGPQHVKRKHRVSSLFYNGKSKYKWKQKNNLRHGPLECTKKNQWVSWGIILIIPPLQESEDQSDPMHVVNGKPSYGLCSNATILGLNLLPDHVYSIILKF